MTWTGLSDYGTNGTAGMGDREYESKSDYKVNQGHIAGESDLGCNSMLKSSILLVTFICTSTDMQCVCAL